MNIGAAPLRVQGGATKARSRLRFERKRGDILDAATRLINTHGAKGTTLQEVARAVALNTTSVTYYFRRKEHLAAAVFERTIERLHGMAMAAAAMPDTESRVRHFVQSHVGLSATHIRSKAVPLAILSDMRTLDDALRKPLEKRYQQVFREVRNFFGPTTDATRKTLLTARAHILFETMFWLPIWITNYPIDEFPRVSNRLFDILQHGIAPADALWAPIMLSDGVERGAEERDSITREYREAGCKREPVEGSALAFLKAATRLINQRGYRGASVLRIVKELKVTKGSFYHHLNAKDELVLDCFRTSYRRAARIQLAAREADADEWVQISSTIASLLDIQFDADFPLTHTSALQALPATLRSEVVARSNRTAMRFAGSLVEGACKGSLRVVDPAIASQVIIATLNSAYDLRNWASRLPREQAIAIYGSVLATGIIDAPR